MRLPSTLCTIVVLGLWGEGCAPAGAEDLEDPGVSSAPDGKADDPLGVPRFVRPYRFNFEWAQAADTGCDSWLNAGCEYGATVYVQDPAWADVDWDYLHRTHWALGPGERQVGDGVTIEAESVGIDGSVRLWIEVNEYDVRYHDLESASGYRVRVNELSDDVRSWAQTIVLRSGGELRITVTDDP